jgi:hypothetical protein
MPAVLTQQNRDSLTCKSIIATAGAICQLSDKSGLATWIGHSFQQRRDSMGIGLGCHNRNPALRLQSLVPT